MYWLFRSHHGVYIFFLLSGFLITKIALRGDFFYLPFIRNRLLRIYPAFLLALVICGAAGIFMHIPSPTWRDVVANFAFLKWGAGAGVTGIVFNNVTWSLFYEMVFYLSLPLVVMLSRRCGVPVVGRDRLGRNRVRLWPRPDRVLLRILSVSVCWGDHRRTLAGWRQNRRGQLSGCRCRGTVLCRGMSDDYGLSNHPRSSYGCLPALGVIIVCKAIAGGGTLARCLAWTPLGETRPDFLFVFIFCIR